VLVAALPLLVNWTAKAVIDPRPFWVHYYDPETIYFYDGLRMAELHAPHAADNPGTPLQVMSAAISLVTGRTPFAIDAFRLAGYTLALLLTIATMALIVRFNSSPCLTIALIWTYFLAPSAFERDVVWSPEILYFAA